MAPPRIALASRGFRRARRAEIPPRASRRARGARARSRARARQEKEDDSPEIETARPAPHERRTPSRRARDGGRDGVEKGTRAGSRARTSTRRRERAAGGFQWAFARAPRRFSHRPSRAFLPSGPPRPVRHTGPVRLRSRCPTDRPEAGRGGVPSPLPVAEDAPAPAVRPRRGGVEVARGRAPARRRRQTRAARRDRGARRGVRPSRREGRAGRPRVCVGWRSAPGKRRSVPLVRIRRAPTDPRNTCWSEHNINPEIALHGTRKQIVTIARRTPSHSAKLVRICVSYYVRVGSNLKGTDGLVVE